MSYVEALKREYSAELQRYKNALVLLHAENERLRAELAGLRGQTATRRTGASDEGETVKAGVTYQGARRLSAPGS